jgi:hypothetical protein
VLPYHGARYAQLRGQVFAGNEAGPGGSEELQNLVFVHSEPGAWVQGQDKTSKERSFLAP